VTAGQEKPIPERFAQVRHVRLDGLDRARRRSLAPQLIDQTIARDYLPASQQQHRQDGPLLMAAQRQRAIAIEHLKRPKNPEIKHGFRNPAATLAPPALPRRVPANAEVLPDSNRIRPPLDRSPAQLRPDSIRPTTRNVGGVPRMRLNQTVITAMLMLALAIAGAPGAAHGSGDARSQSTVIDDGCPGQSSVAPIIVRVNAPKTGLDWGDVGIGAAGAIGITLSALAAAVAINQHHGRRRSDAAEARS
jgi:hypothetical protein